MSLSVSALPSDSRPQSGHSDEQTVSEGCHFVDAELQPLPCPPAGFELTSDLRDGFIRRIKNIFPFQTKLNELHLM